MRPWPGLELRQLSADVRRLSALSTKALLLAGWRDEALRTLAAMALAERPKAAEGAAILVTRALRGEGSLHLQLAGLVSVPDWERPPMARIAGCVAELAPPAAYAEAAALRALLATSRA